MLLLIYKHTSSTAGTVLQLYRDAPKRKSGVWKVLDTTNYSTGVMSQLAPINMNCGTAGELTLMTLTKNVLVNNKV